MHAISKNLNNYYGACYGLAYDQTARKVFLVYDEYSASNSALSQGWFRQLKYSGLPTTFTSNENYIETQTFYKEVKEETLLDNIPVSVAHVGRTYLDGLGRPIQGVSIQTSPIGNDEVQPIEYDQYGRQVKSYLPYTHASQDGAYKSNYAAAQAAFYNNNSNNNSDRIVNDLYPYSERVTENNVANRLEEQSAPGNSWRLGSGHTLVKSMELNVANEVRMWTVNSSTTTSSGYYAADALYKSISTNEMGNITQSFTDKFGKEICIREMPVGCSTATCSKYTYNVYDIFGNLRYIVSPQAVDELIAGGLSTWTITYGGTSNIDKMIFANKYDGRNRVIEKIVPGKAVQYIVYNKLDKPVLVQDGNLRVSSKWLFTKYDALGRVIMTGTYVDNRTVAQIQTTINSWPQFEKSSMTTTTGYENLVYPAAVDTDIKTIEYYDNYNYDFDDNPSVIYSYSAAGFSPEPIPASQNKGRLVCSKKRNLSNNNWLITIYHYDKYGRRIQERSNNHKNYAIQNSVTSQYDFGGALLNKKEVVTTISDVITMVERFEYSNCRKLKNVYHKINNQSEILLTSLKLNELGQLVEKNLHSENVSLR